MSLPLVVRPEAQADLLAARDWYEQQRPGLGDDFSHAAEELLDRIAAIPKLYRATLKDVRRAKLRRFPYVVYYRMLADCVEVLAQPKSADLAGPRLRLRGRRLRGPHRCGEADLGR